MKRTTLFLDPLVERDLRLFAERQGRSTASVVREALVQWVDAQREARVPRPGFVAMGRSGHTDTAERHEALVFDGLEPHDAKGGRPPASRPRHARKVAARHPKRER
jgi:hypothetical protein